MNNSWAFEVNVLLRKESLENRCMKMELFWERKNLLWTSLARTVYIPEKKLSPLGSKSPKEILLKRIEPCVM